MFPKNQSGANLAKFLRKENIEPEMTAPDYVVCMTGAGDTKRSIKKLLKALFDADKCVGKYEKTHIFSDFPHKQALPLCDAKKSEKITCKLANSIGRISAGYVWAYPPGVPILTPGEEISAEILGRLSVYEKNGISLSGDIKDGEILVIK